MQLYHSTRHWCIEIYGHGIIYSVEILDTPVNNLTTRKELTINVYLVDVCRFPPMSLELCRMGAAIDTKARRNPAGRGPGPSALMSVRSKPKTPKVADSVMGPRCLPRGYALPSS